MQERVISATIVGSWRMINLRPSLCTPVHSQRVGGGRPAVLPVSPGHVRRLHSYPPGPRRRR
jgi:hypothetical protein